MHSRELKRCIKRILEGGLLPTQESVIAVRLVLCGVWNAEIPTLRIEDLEGKVLTVRGKRERKVVLDTNTAQLVRWHCKQKRRSKGKIIDLSINRICTLLSRACKEVKLRFRQPSTEFRKVFIDLSIEGGRNALSVLAQAGKKTDPRLTVPSIEEREKDFDSKPII